MPQTLFTPSEHGNTRSPKARKDYIARAGRRYNADFFLCPSGNKVAVIVRRIIAVTLSLALLIWLLQSTQWQALKQLAVSVPGATLAQFFVLLFISYLLRAARMTEEFRHQASSFGQWFSITLVHNAVLNVLPFRSGELAFPYLLKKRLGLPIERSLASLLWLRLQDAIVLLGLALAFWPGLPMRLRLALLLAILVASLLMPQLIKAVARRFIVANPVGWRQRTSALAAGLLESSQHARWGGLWTLANWLVKIAAQAQLLAVLCQTTLLIGASGAVGAEAAAVLPIQGIAGFGTYEAGAAALMHLAAIPVTSALQAAFLMHLAGLSSAVICGILAWLLTARPNQHLP